MSGEDRPVCSTERTPPACQCESCRAACQRRPGFFTADQIEPLAGKLGLSIEEMFRDHLQVDYWSGGDLEDTYMFVPRYAGMAGGSDVPWWPTGTCHWFVDGKCQIHALGKPAECRGLGHINGELVTADREAIVRTWVDKQDWVRKLQESHNDR